jgi:ubiquinone/menaquinone biosynthesis C-methylase UbiE
MQTENNDIFADFYQRHKKSPSTGISLLLRRVKQFVSLFSSNFNSCERLLQGMNDRYSSEEEINFYKEWNAVGLLGFEKKALERIRTGGSILVMGAGAGRESFAFAKSFDLVVGVDCNPKMIATAKDLAQKSNSKCKFYEKTDEIGDQQFDVIFITPSLNSHTPGKQNRIEFLKQLKRFSHQKTKLLYYAEVIPLRWTHRHFWGAFLFRLRLLFSSYSWEPGDVVKSYLGYHNTDSRLLYYHFYPSQQTVLNELKLAGWKSVEQIPEGFYISLPS